MIKRSFALLSLLDTTAFGKKTSSRVLPLPLPMRDEFCIKAPLQAGLKTSIGSASCSVEDCEASLLGKAAFSPFESALAI